MMWELSCVSCCCGSAGAADGADGEDVLNDFFLNLGDLGGGDLGGSRRSGGRTGIVIFLLPSSLVSIVTAEGALL